jgi:hypothetical protein
MPRLSDRIENVLNETRMLMLGGQVLLGFSYRICFEPAFDRLPSGGRIAQVTALTVMTVGLSWLVWPAAFHRIAERGWQTERIHSFTTGILDWALLPFCVGLGLSFYPVSLSLRVPHAGLIAIFAGSLALMAWYGWALLRPDRPKSKKMRPGLQKQEQQQSRDSDLTERIKKALIECRMALPGAQAFLGFQLSIVFTENFQRLPRSSQLIHFGSLVCMTLAIVLLIAPAAYHRLAEGGEDTENFHRVASYLLLAGLVFLAPGMAGDLYVVLRKVSDSIRLATIIAGGLLVACYTLWFGLSAFKKSPSS